MNATILLVDDNVTNLKLAADVLELEGHCIVKALDANEALAVLETLSPDLILMDLAMPGMDGLTLTRLLKAEPRFRHVPIVALTASAMKGDDRRALAAGCDGYITKPIDTRTFGRTVATYFRAVVAGP
jgi:CheY-like chemotaxis protein